MRAHVRALHRLSVVAVFASFGLALVAPTISTYAEGTHQFNTQQELSNDTRVYVDVLNNTETINISLCNGGTLRIYDTEGTPMDLGDDTMVNEDTEYMGNLDCEAAVPNPITNAYEFTPGAAGTYRIDLSSTNDQHRFDFTVTPNNSTNPNPTLADGRVWSYEWDLSADGPTGAEEGVTNIDMYALVPAPDEDESFVWKLDLNNFSGGSYTLAANNIGLDAPYSGISYNTSSDVTPLYPIYLGYPAVAGGASTTQPAISSLSFMDADGEDDTFSPGGTSGVQDTGTFKFTSNVSNATYAITIDTNQDGVYGTGDRVLLGEAVSGVNEVEWDGKYANEEPVAEGNYNARLQLRIGEFHFVASDVETSGGSANGEDWTNGLTIYKATGPSTTENTTVYWDDTQLTKEHYDEVLDEYSEVQADGVYSNLPNGVTSGSNADANGDGRADGFHTWGDFTGGSVGDSNNIDTFVYGASDTEYITMGVAPIDGTDDDGVSSSIEYLANNNGDGNGDGIQDHQQENVTSLPNPAVNDAYATLAVTGTNGCDSLSSVSIFSEGQLSSFDNGYEYPVGLMDFNINCTTPGGTADIKVYYDKKYDTSTWTARKFINNKYANISGAVFGTATVGGKTVTTMSYAVTDGSSLDADGTVNGVIVDPAGPGTNGTVATTVGAPNTGLEYSGMLLPLFAVSGGLTVLSVTWYVRKRQTQTI
ncbi:MAG TPA: choice-of-anchor U domain-containing protein [Candidatus Saccharimonadales bacterium]|nr:choice-of-anchor U domain-containing protein [Candidatus Saccharimonadales bacterium]